MESEEGGPRRAARSLPGDGAPEAGGRAVRAERRARARLRRDGDGEGDGREGAARGLPPGPPAPRAGQRRRASATTSWWRSSSATRGGRSRGRWPPATATSPRPRASTLFIDEVGDMSPLAQVRLLRFLEGGEYQRLGETVARTGGRPGDQRDERGPRAARAGGTLPRGPLVPPERRAHRRAPAARAGKRRAPPGAALPARAGGVGAERRRRRCRARRRPRSSTTRGRATSASSRTRCAAWACGPRAGRSKVEDLSRSLRARSFRRAGTLRAALRHRETELVQDALQRHGGIISRAAAELGITRQALWAKVRRLGLVSESA